MSKRTLFSRRYDLEPEMLLDFLQQALAAMPAVTSFQLAESGDRINFTTSFTLTSWGDKMQAAAEPDGPGRSALTVSGEPRVGILSTPWGEEMHAAAIESQLFSALDPSIALTKINPVVLLQADHRRVEALFQRIQATDNGERAELVHQLVTALRVHMELEENHVYPLLSQEIDADLAEEAEVEHQLARDGLAQLEELTPDEPGFDGALAMVMAGIEHHVSEEEGEAFPRLTQRLGPERLRHLAEELFTVRAELLEEVHNADQSQQEKADRDQDEQERGVRLEQAQREQRQQDKAAAEERERAEAAKKQRAAARREKTKQEARPARPKRASDRARTPRKNRRTQAINPEETTKADLLERAKKAGLSGYSHMSKAELAKALNKAP